MRSSPLAAAYEGPTEATYEIRVRGEKYIWGSAGITENITFDRPLILHIRNDPFGEVVEFGTRAASGSQRTLGTLQPGECVSIPVQGISGVFATCKLESILNCLVKR